MKTRIFVFLFALASLFSQGYGKINGYLSFEYEKSQEGGRAPSGTFLDPLLGLVFSGELAPKMDYFSEVSLESDAKAEIRQAWLGLKPSSLITLKLGLYLVPFGKYNQASRPHETMLIQTPLNLAKIYPESWRDLGILLEGSMGRFFYSAYLGNGLSEGENLSQGQVYFDTNSDKGKGVRAGLFLTQEWEVAYSHYRGKMDEGNARSVVLQAVDITWAADGFQFLSEFTRADIENPEEYTDGKSEGYFVQVSFPVKNVHPVLSYQKMKYEDPFHGEGFMAPDMAGAGISEEMSYWTVGVFYTLSPDIFFKLEYNFNRKGEEGIKANLLSVQVALKF